MEFGKIGQTKWQSVGMEKLQGPPYNHFRMEVPTNYLNSASHLNDRKSAAQLPCLRSHNEPYHDAHLLTKATKNPIKFHENLVSDKLSPTAPEFRIRQVKREEIAPILYWRNGKLGFKGQLYHFQLIFDTYPQGWYVAVVDRNKGELADKGEIISADGNEEIIGTIFGINLSDDISSGGLFAVVAKHRRNGVGGALWSMREKYLGGRNLSINADVSRIKPNMAKGMKPLFAVIHYEGILNPTNTPKILNHEAPLAGIEIIEAKDDTKLDSYTARLIQYDSQIQSYSRAKFIRGLLNLATQYQTPSKFYIAIETKQHIGDPNNNHLHHSAQKVVGYGVLRPIYNAYTFSPWYADSPEIAKMLLRKAVVEGIWKLPRMRRPVDGTDTEEILDNYKPGYSETFYLNVINDHLPQEFGNDLDLLHNVLHNVWNIQNNNTNLEGGKDRFLKELINDLKLKPIFMVCRMYSHQIVNVPYDKVYSLTALDSFLY